ncbi:hypothetical protein [Caulobacter henricii]|nr:hypothetical protein [Caulobacter henricii]
MSGFWRNWLMAWCGSVVLFGAVLVGGGFEATSGPVRLIFGFLDGPMPLDLNAQMRFSLALMGAVSIGWAVTAAGMIQAGLLLGERGRPVWLWLTAGVLTWFIIDTPMSIATGYGLNALPNLFLLVTFLLPILRSGVLRAPRHGEAGDPKG